MAAQLDYPIPQRPSTTQLLTAFNSASVRWPSALRAGLAILIPGAIALLTGHDYAILLLATGAFAALDVPAAIAQLAAWPYGCSEQLASAAMPLLYAASLAPEGAPSRPDDAKAVDEAIAQILTRQGATQVGQHFRHDNSSSIKPAKAAAEWAESLTGVIEGVTV
mgnify:CR=1 FL=1